MRYEWDSSKEKANIKKHGVSFADAEQALNCGLVVVVAYPEDEITRIISARKANKSERKIYEAQL
jgi:uncharacterized DUF497 family protein